MQDSDHKDRMGRKEKIEDNEMFSTSLQFVARLLTMN